MYIRMIIPTWIFYNLLRDHLSWETGFGMKAGRAPKAGFIAIVLTFNCQF